MSSFFRKKKKASPGETPKVSPQPREPPAAQVPVEPPTTELSGSTDCETSPTVVREPTSIFGGMVLSSSVRKREGRDSPYLSSGQETKAEKDKESSAFGFITAAVEPPPLPGGDSELEETQGEEAGGQEVSAFGFISPESTDPPSEESGFSFIDSPQPDHRGEGGEAEKTANSPETVDMSQATHHKSSPDISTPSQSGEVTSVSRSTEPSQPGFRNSSGVFSPVPGPTTSPPLVSSDPHPVVAAAGGGTPEGGRVSVGKQQLTTGKRKKKRKVVRPGQEKLEDPVLVETTSEASAPSMSDVLLVVVGGEGGELSRSEPDSLSLTSQTSSVETTSALSTVPPPSSLASSEPAAMTLHHSEGREKEVGVGEGEKPSSQASSETTTKPKMDSTPSHREKEKGVREGEVGDGSVEIQQEVLMDTQLLVDTTDSTSDSLCVEGEGGGGGGSVMFQDQQLLTEVFAGGEATCELGEIGEGEGGNGEKEREERDDKSGNYSVELSSSDQFTLLIQSSESNLARIRLELVELHTKKHSLLEQHVSTAKLQRQNRQKMKELRARETKALSDEDYELAEELQGQLQSVSQDSSCSIASAAHPLLREWLQEVCDLIVTEEKVQSDMRTQLATMREQQSEALSSAEEKMTATQTKQKMKLKALEDRIDRDRGHIALDNEHLHRREQQLEEEIATRAEKFISKKTSLQEELQTVHSGIAELEERLTGLRREGARLEAAISEEEAKIQAVHHELDSENSSLREERENISRREQDLLTQQEGVEDVRREYEVAQQEQKTQKESIGGVLGRVDVKWEESERRTHTLEQCLGRAGDLDSMDTSSLLNPSPQLQRSREVVQEGEGEVKAVAVQVESLQETISQLRQQISASEERIPRLEETKKTAVAARQYKEAGRVSSELKQLKIDLEPQRAQLKEREGEVAVLDQRLAAISSELAREREHLDQLERQEDVEHLRQLTSSIARLQAMKASIPGSSAPLGQVLNCWIQLYQLLADGLCAKHDLDLTDFTPHTEADTQPPEETVDNHDKLDPQLILANDATSAYGDDGDTQSDVPETVPSLKPPEEERTPGVGREEEEEEAERQVEVAEVKRKIEQLEARIEEAVSEDMEDYELAAELDKELTSLKYDLTRLVES